MSATPQSIALLVCDDPSLTEAIENLVASIAQLQLKVVSSVHQASHLLRKSNVVFLLVHLGPTAPTENALRLLKAIQQNGRHIPLVAIAERYEAAEGLRIMGQGALDYLGRPLDLTRLACLMDLLTVGPRLAGAAAEPATAERPDAPSQTVLELLGRDLTRIQRIASGDSTVFVSGETGTGKTRLAQLLHEQSARRAHPFMTVHCGAISPNLLESELFGHVEGAFTGASHKRVGKLAEVGQGTLLLDDIDCLPIEVQTKLLRVIDERKFEPVGSNTTVRFEARLVVATNRDLEQEAAEGRFRADLYYRFNVVELHLSPLRDRPHSILPLVRHFTSQCTTVEGNRVTDITPEAARALEAYTWPGNLRELRNVVERAVALCSSDKIQMRDLPLKVRKDLQPCAVTHATATAVTQPVLVRSKEEAEIRCIEDALKKHQYNRLRAAAELGISRMTLYNKMHRYQMAGRR